jgi:ferrous iron transport protein B
MYPSTPAQVGVTTGSIALVGHPNVGKSVIFQRLTGQHVTISNYPGTTVEITRGEALSLLGAVLIDTPGVFTFPPQSEDELVTTRVLLNEPLQAVVQVGDAKNLRRTLLLTVQLAEMGFPLVLVLNMMDEAGARGVVVNHQLLAEYLTCPVVPTVAIKGLGLQELVEVVKNADHPHFRLTYPAEIEAAVAEVSLRLPDAPITPRALALLWFSGDSVSESWLREHLDQSQFAELCEIRHSLQLSFVEPLLSIIQRTRLDYVQKAAKATLVSTGAEIRKGPFDLGHLTTHPVWGLFFLAAVLGAILWFVGIFGAGTLVGLLEEQLFYGVINPWVVGLVTRFVPIPLVVDFLVGEYGQWTMGVTYAFALIFPIVTTFFLAFGVLEDSGYLPRLAALSNRFFHAMGLNGKAVLPMVLGLGCVTMATLTARVLESKRERVLVTLLLALAVPCSAQLGVVLGMLSAISLQATIIWGSVVVLVMLAVGWLAAHVLPGERSSLLVDLPPLRLPLVSNVVVKTLARLEWYLKEVIPLFLIGTAVMFVLDKTGLLAKLILAGEPLVAGWLGLPPESSAAFIMGFLRRDFGASGLFVMQSQGLLNPVQVVVAMTTVTLFVPCIASVLMIAKERTWQTASGIVIIIFPLAFLVGGLLNRILLLIGWGAS